MLTLPVLLSHIKNIDWFTFPIHFSEVGYYHDFYGWEARNIFLDRIKNIAINNNIASLSYIYPWDGDNFHLAGQPPNSYCGIWTKNWDIQYNILGNIENIS